MRPANSTRTVQSIARPAALRWFATRRLKVAAAGATVALLLGPAAPWLAPAPGGQAIQDGRGTLLIYQDGRTASLSVEIVATPESRAKGLMFRTSMPENSGMLFAFEADGRWAFWMKNTYIPLSIGFIDSRLRLLEVLDMQVAPDPANGPFTVYEPKSTYRYALEVNQGYFRRHGISPGARMELIPAK